MPFTPHLISLQVVNKAEREKKCKENGIKETDLTNRPRMLVNMSAEAAFSTIKGYDDKINWTLRASRSKISRKPHLKALTVRPVTPEKATDRPTEQEDLYNSYAVSEPTMKFESVQTPSASKQLPALKLVKTLNKGIDIMDSIKNHQGHQPLCCNFQDTISNPVQEYAIWRNEWRNYFSKEG